MEGAEEINFTMLGTATTYEWCGWILEIHEQYSTNQFGNSQNGHARELWDELYQRITLVMQFWIDR